MPLSIVLAAVFGVTLFLGVPIAFSIGITALAGLVLMDVPLHLAILKYFSGLDIFSFMAIPFFVLAGELMNIAGITKPLVDLADMVVGRMRGGLAQVTIIASGIFASITGSATSAASTLGSTLVPEMTRKGYDLSFSCGVIAASSVLGPIIPPSILMIILASITGISVGGLFIAGILPGVIFMLALMIPTWVVARRHGYPIREERIKFYEGALRAIRAIPAMLMPVIILGGVFSGVFSVTEASAVSVGYAFLFGLLKRPRAFLRELYPAVARSMSVSVMILTIIGSASILSWVLAADMIAQRVAEAFLEISRNPYVFLGLINVFYLVVGCLMEPGAAIIITVPLLLPLAEQVGINPMHFGLVVVLNLSIGFITPPVGLCLYVLCGITKVSLEKMVRSVLIFLTFELLALLMVTYIPWLALYLPMSLGFAK